MTEREVRNLLYPARPDSAVTPLGRRVEGESSTLLTGRTALIGVVVAGIDTTTRSEPAALHPRRLREGNGGISPPPFPRVLHSVGWWT